jgi:hypothetical protein
MINNTPDNLLSLSEQELKETNGGIVLVLFVVLMGLYCVLTITQN